MTRGVVLVILSAAVVAGGLEPSGDVSVLVAGGLQPAGRAARQAREADATLPSGTVSGTVTTGSASHQPAAHALVMVAGTDVGLLRVTTADEAGRFSFPGLPAGHLMLAASKPGTLPAMYGAARIGRSGQVITLSRGQQLRDLTIALARGAVVTGVVTDDHGQPVTNARVRVLPRRVIGDEIALGADAGSLVLAATDDRGAYRIYDIPPGEYVVAVQPRSSIGGAFIAGSGPAGNGPALNHAAVFYPSASNPADATSIGLTEGDVKTGIDIHTRLVRLARLDGVVEGLSNGPARNVQLTLHPRGWGATGTVLNTLNTGVGPDGRFTFGAVPPGEYTLQARTLPPPAPPDMTGGGPPPLFDARWAMRDLTVSGANLTNLTLTLRDSITVSGRLVIEGLSRLPDDLAVRVGLRPTPASGVPVIPEPQTVDSKGAFSFTRLLPGKYRLYAQVSAIDINVPPEWIPKSAMVNGVDALDVPVEITPDTATSPLVITLTDEMQEVTGVVRDAAGQLRRDVTVAVFPVERRFWFPQSRRIAVRQSHAGGEFVFGEATALPPGDYYAAVATDLGLNEQYDPAVLAVLAQGAQRFTLEPNGSKALNLIVSAGRRPPG
jgi:hypothetical protein